MSLIDLGLIIAATGCNDSRAKIWQKPLSEACLKYGISTPRQLCVFLSQVGVESAGLSAVVENLNYSIDGLMKVFGKYFTLESACRYARNPQKIANRVYSNRMGNGDEGSGDGWRYRGRGLIQLTGKSNYSELSKLTGIDFVNSPELLEQPDNAAISAAWFFVSRKCLDPASAGDIAKVTRIINGGMHGYDRRLALFNAAEQKVIKG